MWRNPGETGWDANGKDKASNGIDDDRNGYIDDVVGWDFASDDNRPYDLSTDSPIELILTGGNPGHGTHCAGNVGARADNNLGIAGVAPNIRLMAVRFLTEKGQGTTSGAIKSIKYAVDNGAKVLSNSWGAAGEDPKEGEANKALQDMIKYSQEKGVLFVAAAGNGRGGVGYNNDTDSQPVYPASYTFENILSVAALDSEDQLGKFSNWGRKSVDLAAPGVKIFSTVPGNRYQETVINMPDMGIVADWDGTSMATPHVAGAAALYWSANPQKNWQEVKKAVLNSTISVPALSGKTVSGGKLNVEKLMR
jgi:subtilisin family serine protease